MADRYFVETPIDAAEATLEGPEAHHLAHVMRAAPGDEVTLFDGQGAEFAARVVKVGRSQVRLAIVARREVDRELPCSVTLGVALPKGDRQRWLVEKIVELGATRLVPLHTARGVAQPIDKALARLRRAAIEASKQCGRNRLLEIAEPQAWADFLAIAPAEATRLIAHPGSTDSDAAIAAAADYWLAVGPEGGFTDEEVEQARAAGWRCLELGPRILRVETACVYLVSLIAAQRQ